MSAMTDRRNPARRCWQSAAVAAAGVLLIAGCSQVKGLAVSGNMDVIYLSTASTDVLLSQKISIRDKPVCTLDDKKQQSYSCTGTTSDSKPIAVTVADGTVENPTMVITVGGQQVFSGPALTVIQQNAEASK